jgi:hypothetical protein
MFKKILFFLLLGLNLVFAARDGYNVNVYELISNDGNKTVKDILDNWEKNPDLKLLTFKIIKDWKIEESKWALFKFLQDKYLIGADNEYIQLESVVKNGRIRFVEIGGYVDTEYAEQNGFTYEGMQFYLKAELVPIPALWNQFFDIWHLINNLRGLNKKNQKWTSGTDRVTFKFTQDGTISGIKTSNIDLR